jgi:hypothetical protein
MTPEVNRGRGVVEEQTAYYRARAGEYDQWLFRQGRYDRGEPWNRLWFDEVEALRREVESVPRCETVLELPAALESGPGGYAASETASRRLTPRPK